MKEPIRIELPTEFTIGSVNAYLFIEPEPTLIDCGLESADCTAALESGLAAHGLQVADLKKVILTHAHVDHMGMIGWLAERCEATFWVNQHCYDWAVDVEGCWEVRNQFLADIMLKGGVSPERVEIIVEGFRAMGDIWRGVSADRVQVYAADGEIEIGGQPWQVVYLPGHSVTQTGFYNAQHGWLFSADSLLQLTPVPVIEYDFQLKRRSYGLPIHLTTLDTLLALDCTRVFPGHGKVIDNYQRLVGKQIERIHARKELSFNLVKAGKQTIPAITSEMYSQFSEVNRFLGLTMVLGYLDLLSAEKRVERQEIDGVWHYSAVDQR